MAVHGNVAHTSAPRVGREGRGHSSLVQLKKEQEAKRVRLNPPSAAQGAGAGAGGGGVKGGAQALEKPPLDATLVALLTGRGIKPPPNRPTLQR